MEEKMTKTSQDTLLKKKNKVVEGVRFALADNTTS